MCKSGCIAYPVAALFAEDPFVHIRSQLQLQSAFSAFSTIKYCRWKISHPDQVARVLWWPTVISSVGSHYVHLFFGASAGVRATCIWRILLPKAAALSTACWITRFLISISLWPTCLGFFGSSKCKFSPTKIPKTPSISNLKAKRILLVSNWQAKISFK